MRYIYMIAALAMLAPPGKADVFCAFTVQALWVTNDGWMNLGLGGSGYSKNYWICPVNGNTTVNDGNSTKTVTADTCKTLY